MHDSKAAEEKRLEDELYQQKLLLISENTKIKNILQEIADIEKRIKTAESNDLYTEKDIKEMDNEDIHKTLGIGFAFAGLGVFFFIVGLVADGAIAVIETIGGVVAFLIAGIIISVAFSDIKKYRESRFERMNSKNAEIIKDKKNVNYLKTEIVRKQDELKNAKQTGLNCLLNCKKKKSIWKNLKRNHKNQQSPPFGSDCFAYVI